MNLHSNKISQNKIPPICIFRKMTHNQHPGRIPVFLALKLIAAKNHCQKSIKRFFASWPGFLS